MTKLKSVSITAMELVQGFIGVINMAKDLWNETNFTEFPKYFGALIVGIFYCTYFLIEFCRCPYLIDNRFA